ncbi:hypothetical protein [Microbacterium sp. 13-71-7]|jgi:hypothetical protein|uniref:hypothetical protein n=1 Tax=Microbacterium sp. 13-71-7 TaxID=1970399 RepID=UPI000BC8D205|nr:hypothetical protein [Microbacterium sp. 13-71-7]OZB85739.1 MAG: hypothetical protein B7X32_02400 [Microbacterium sp. 13-71-7]
MTDRKDTLIRINVRPSWYQRTPLPLDSPELLERIELQARQALRDFENAAFVEVFAQSGVYGLAVRLERPVIAVRTAVGRYRPEWLPAE